MCALSVDDLAKATALRSYQSSLLAVYLAGKLDKEKLCQLLTAGHAAFKHAEQESLQELKAQQEQSMEVDDWDAESPEAAQAAASQVSSQSTSADSAKRDEFSYSLHEAMWLHRQQVQEAALPDFDAKILDVWKALRARGVVAER